MDIFEFAMQKEKAAEEFYTELAEKCHSKGLENIYRRLAQAESKHYQIVGKMQSQENLDADADILDDIGVVFNKMAADPDEMLNLDYDQVRIYEKAREIEKESIDLYAEKAAEETDSRRAAIFRKLAEEERKHYAIVDQLVETVILPQQWVENGEFSHILEKERGTAYYPDMSG
ncbi:MAG: ferritin-like domain-containing protein [Verrucomicrobiota bacterium]